MIHIFHLLVQILVKKKECGLKEHIKLGRDSRRFNKDKLFTKIKIESHPPKITFLKVQGTKITYVRKGRKFVKKN